MINYVVKFLVAYICYVLLCVINGVNLDGDAYHVGSAIIVVLFPWITNND